MNAIICTKYGGPDVLELQDVPTPTPKDNEVLIRTYASVVTAADSAIRQANPFIVRFFNGFLKPKHPIMGFELSGEIVEVGSAVTRFNVGDQIMAQSGITAGACAEYICLPEDGALALKPDNISFDEAAALTEGNLTALPFLRDNGNIQAGQRVLINGASGAVGAAGVQLAKHFGAEVTAVCSGGNAELVRTLGADHVIDYTKTDFTKTGQTYDIIFDAVGKSSFGACKPALTENGIYLTTVPAFSAMLGMLWTSKIGSKKAAFAATGLRKDPEKAADLKVIADLAQAGTIVSVIDRVYPLADAAKAHAYVDTERKKGNVVLQSG